MRDSSFAMTPGELATHYLNNSGLDQRERREIFKDIDGVYDADKIRAAILRYYDQAQELDESRLLKGRFTKESRTRGTPANFVKHDSQADIEGTDLTQDIVDFVEDTDGLLLDQSTFDPSNPVYVITNVVEKGGVTPQEVGSSNQQQTYQLLDPSEVMWTSTTYEEDSESPELEDIEEEEGEQEESEEEEEDSEHEEDSEEDGEEEASEDELLTQHTESAFEDAYKQCCADNEIECDEAKMIEQMEVYVTGFRSGRKNGKGKGETRPRSQSRGRKDSKRRSGKKRTDESRRSTKSDSHFQTAYKKPKKGPHRSLSSTRGYTPQAQSSLQLTTKKIPMTLGT